MTREEATRLLGRLHAEPLDVWEARTVAEVRAQIARLEAEIKAAPDRKPEAAKTKN